MTTYKKDNEDFPVRGLILHDKCGMKLTASWSRGNGGRYVKYRCTRCPKTNYNRDDDNKGIEGIKTKFLKFLKTYNYKHELKTALVKAIEINLEERNKQNKSKVAAIEKEILEKTALNRQLVEKNISGVISDSLAKKMISENEQEVSDLELELRGLQDNSDEIMKVVEHSISIFEDISSFWLRVDLEIKKRFQKFLFPHGLPFDGEKFGRIGMNGRQKHKRDSQIHRFDANFSYLN